MEQQLEAEDGPEHATPKGKVKYRRRREQSQYRLLPQRFGAGGEATIRAEKREPIASARAFANQPDHGLGGVLCIWRRGRLREDLRPSGSWPVSVRAAMLNALRAHPAALGVVDGPQGGEARKGDASGGCPRRE